MNHVTCTTLLSALSPFNEMEKELNWDSQTVYFVWLGFCDPLILLKS